MRLSELGEAGLLRELERRGLAREIGDDGALLGDGLVVSQDILLEGIHFRFDWTSWRDLGYKAAAVNLSDLAAMGANPTSLLVSVGLPAETDAGDVVALYEGLNEPGRAGGRRGHERSRPRRGRRDRVRALGARPRPGGGEAGRRPRRHGPARRVGRRALYALRAGLPGFDELVERHRRPPLRLAEGRLLARTAHALMDLSDGIASDAARIAERSRCRVVVDVDRLPLAAGLERLPAAEPFWTLGEDYEPSPCSPRRTRRSRPSRW